MTSGAVIPPAPPAGGAPRPGRAAATRAALLEAAREVFTSAGFAEASIAEVVARAGASVGSLYHHFGGKADLFLAVYEAYAVRQETRSAAAVRAAKEAGVTDRVALFVAGARAYLDGCWEERDLARLFLAGGGPPGFDLVARRRYREWTRRNAVLLEADESEPFGEALVLVLTTVTQEAGWEVAVCETADRAQRLAEEVLALIARVGSPARAR
ncbi:MAG TPA: helix-turn-helix domain-containing protein [Miltoncostaeaceae bacterium]|nr:helix-turn-helix domain-containing protein [Miltoncostaeaceae bacterium]